ncbi:MAG: NADH-quinone oxidoreductase subunit A [Chloroflexi bacterium]|nr:NADH-quinone oxidoreductase subunit A [Chloroflexota bacterium]
MPAEYAANYIAVLVATVLGAGMVVVSFFLGWLLAPRKATPQKLTPYECGIPPIGQHWQQVHLRYYLYAILFLIFDVEAAFVFPWAVIFARSNSAVFWEMILFIGILCFGLCYGWRKGVFQWR